MVAIVEQVELGSMTELSLSGSCAEVGKTIKTHRWSVAEHSKWMKLEVPGSLERWPSTSMERSNQACE